MTKQMKKINKHLQKMEEHYENIIDSLELDEKTIQMFNMLFIIASKTNDKTMNKIAKDIDNFRRNEYDGLGEYEGLFDIDE